MDMIDAAVALAIANSRLCRFTHCIDSGNPTGVLQMCAPDLKLNALGLEGDAELLLYQMREREEAGHQSRHTVSSVRIDYAGEGAIAGAAIIVSYRKKEWMTSSAIADWAFRLELRNGDWLFTEIGLDLFGVVEHE